MSTPSPAQQAVLDIYNRTQAVIKHPDTLQTIIDTVANGGSLIDLCEAWKARYSDISQWLMADPERNDVYNNAKYARGEWFVQSLLRQLNALSNVDIREAYDDNGNLLDIKKIPAHVAAAIAGIETVEEHDKDGNKTGTVRKLKLYEKNRSIELMGKNLHMFLDRVVHTGAVAVVHKVDRIDLDERIRQITQATVTVMEAERLKDSQP